jgi:alcohol dehydrogenase
MPAADYPAMLDLITRGKLRPDLLIGRTIDLAEAPEALAAMSHPSQAPGITVIDLSERRPPPV